MQTTKAGAVPVGTSALLLGISVAGEVDNEPLLRRLFRVERDIVDSTGAGWEEYARAIGREE